MCSIFLAYDYHPKYFLIIAANRDEYYNRPTLSAHYWQDNLNILGGRDLEKMGTWLGITKDGRYAAVTNYRDPSTINENARSRGELVSGFLNSKAAPKSYMEKVSKKSGLYNGYNLLTGDKRSLYYYSNQNNQIEQLLPGIYGLSNHLLDTPWSKVNLGKDKLRKCLENQQVEPKCLFNLLLNDTKAEDDELPDTGIGLIKERLLSPIFIKSPNYGTRSSTVVLIDRDSYVEFIERTFNNNDDTWQEVSYGFKIE